VGYKILLADDSVTVQKIITLTFSDEGVDVQTVNNGDEAISRLQYTRPALVMADVSIPGKNGYEICEFVKSHPEMKDTPVILLVPAFERFDEERARRIGADYHLTKPFQSIRTLISTVKNLAERKIGPEFSVVGSGLTAIRGAERNEVETTDFDPKKAKIDELIKISSEEPSANPMSDNSVEDEILLEIDLAQDDARYPDSLALASNVMIESMDDPAEDASPFAQATGSIDRNSHFPTDVSHAASPDLNLPDPHLSDPDLTGPDLTGPDLTGPDLTGPDLTGPDLTGPDLTGPNLTGPDLNDDVLELEDILPDKSYGRVTAVIAVADAHSEPSQSAAPSSSLAPVEDQTETRAETQGSLIIPQSAIDEIVNRVSLRLSEELSEKLCGEIARRIAPEIAELIKRQFSAEPVVYHNSENLLDID
jgi:CheY-like chemotaxis protein